MYPVEATGHAVMAVGRVDRGNGGSAVATDAAAGAATVDTTKRDSGSKVTSEAGAAGRTLGANLTAVLTSSVGVDGRSQTLPVLLFR